MDAAQQVQTVCFTWMTSPWISKWNTQAAFVWFCLCGCDLLHRDALRFMVYKSLYLSVSIYLSIYWFIHLVSKQIVFDEETQRCPFLQFLMLMVYPKRNTCWKLVQTSFCVVKCFNETNCRSVNFTHFHHLSLWSCLQPLGWRQCCRCLRKQQDCWCQIISNSQNITWCFVFF